PPELIEIGIGAGADGPVAAQKVHKARRRYRDLRRARGDRADKREFVGRDPADPLELSLHIGGLELGGAALGVMEVERRRLGGESVDGIDKTEEPGRTSKLAVGDRLQANVLLQRDGLSDAAVLHLAKGPRAHAGAMECTKGILELLRPQ